MKLSIVIPCYNEQASLVSLTERFAKICADNPSLEVVLVDNGSTDNSAAVLAELAEQYAFLRIVTVEHNQGYGYGILAGLKECETPFVGWTHADLQTDPSDVQHAYQLLMENQFNERLFIKGVRKRRHWFDQFFSLGMSAFESLYLKTFLWEINAQPTIFARSFFNSWQNPPHDFSLDLYAYYQAKKQALQLIRLPVLFPEREHGQSHWNRSFADKIKFIKRTLSYSRELKRKLG